MKSNSCLPEKLLVKFHGTNICYTYLKLCNVLQKPSMVREFIINVYDQYYAAMYVCKSMVANTYI